MDVNVRNGVFGPSGYGGGLFDATTAIGTCDTPGAVRGLGGGHGGGHGGGGHGGGHHGGGGHGHGHGGGGFRRGGWRGGGGGWRGDGGWDPVFLVEEESICDVVRERRLRGLVTPQKEREYEILCGPAISGIGAAPDYSQCTMDPGSKSAAVTQLQQALNAALDKAEYLPITVSGVYDAATCGAIFTMKGEFDAKIAACPGGYDVPLKCPETTMPQKKTSNYTGLAMGIIGGLGVLAAVFVAASAK